MKLRAITGFFFIIVMLGSVLLGQYVFDVFYLVLGAFCLWEFYSNVKKSSIKPNLATGLLGGVMIYLVYAIINYHHDAFHTGLPVLLPVVLSFIFIQELFKKHDAPFTNIAYTYLGIFFTVVPFTFFHALGYINGGFTFHFPMAFLLMLWANDTGAYLVGSKLGKHKLFERHSPKKTWEGFVGGMLITAGAALWISHYFADIPPVQWVIVGVLISCFGTLGDLVESMFKRSIDVKDSGGLLPGHGGLLDRFDGLLIAAPIVYTYLYVYFIIIK
ncbi:MAG: phosphatidate cytidylyltransferase [Mucilaginibacter sp.]